MESEHAQHDLGYVVSCETSCGAPFEENDMAKGKAVASMARVCHLTALSCEKARASLTSGCMLGQ